VAISSSSASARSAVTADINVTPMADVMLVLLIIFMITAPLIASGFEAQMPQGINLIKAPEEDTDIVLGLDRDGNYFLQTAPIAKADLQGRLTEIYNARTQDRILYLKADHSLKMERIQEAVALARQAGVRVIAAVTEQQPGTEPTVATEREGGR
jgi:biopolymer transport protein ExbD